MKNKEDQEIKVCVDKIGLVDEVLNVIEKSNKKTSTRLRRKVPGIMEITKINNDLVQPLELALVKSNQWRPGQRLRVKFLNGDPYIHKKIKKFAKKWEKYANIKFNFISRGYAEIRIALRWRGDRGSWSYLGNYALRIPENRPTMNYGWFTRNTKDNELSRTVLHEFGHALAAIHEHAHPLIKIPWNKKAVYKYYMGPPNNWTKEDVDRQVLAKYSTDHTNYSKPDKKSIMLYPISNAHTIGNYSVGMNRKLSRTDKKFIRKMYPFRRR